MTTILRAAALAALASSGAFAARGELGTAANPIKFFLVPSVDAKLLESSGRKVVDYLEKNTPYKYRFAVPQSYVAVVESFGTNRADVAALNTFGYILAHERYGAQARLTFVRHGARTYQGQIIARADGKVKTLKDIDGKKFAYVDPSSTSGYLLPAKLFADKGIKPKETMFAQKHDNVVTMVHQGQVDAGATFYSPPHNGKLEDARRLVTTQFPDVEKTVKIIALTDHIPNDPIVVRKGMPEDMKKAVIAGILKFMQTAEGKRVFKEIYSVSSMVPADDSHYDGVRAMLRALGKNAADLGKK